ncbi:leucyl aminopeptidase family protein [Chryseobacterium sp.]|uniref:leucyl aminopeptidase family protein n=1 Tax=Chryseobacterium sp. TaxID=1871047 RepID=UPI0011CAC0DB|nr:leucyl aminopeptidase family protein [Chryseobacterium sp.]TXF79055.1 leucyl aminopeptidase family protein [Chryseobacterium sp.]
MITINITNQPVPSAAQKFTFFTEEMWKKAQNNYPPTLQNLFSGKKNEVFVSAEESSVDFMIGLGANPQNFEIQAAASKFAYDFRKKIQSVPTSINDGEFNQDQAGELAKGLFLGTYSYPFKGEHLFFKPEFSAVLQSVSEEGLKNLQLKILALCEGQFACMEWLNKPQNFKKVPHISQFLQEISEKHQLKRTVFNRKESEDLGLGAFVSVNQGSAQEAAFTVLEYKTDVKDAKTIGLVGKCVLFDTGGISIKPSENLHYMKSDMGGATAVIGALIAAATLKLPVNLVVILPITDNAVSNTASIPSDVVTAYNGKTIEVLNTDAEGRMTLADGLSYLSKNYKTDALIDLATLTGSSVRMFGYTCGAYFSNNENLKNALEKSGDATNQRLWNLPLWDIWKDDFKSDVADFKNISSKPFGDCIIAGKFLEQFIEGHPNWAHLDIAGVAFGNVGYMTEKGATGYGVQLLLDFLENYS